MIHSDCESQVFDLSIMYGDYCQKIQLTAMIHKQSKYDTEKASFKHPQTHN